MKNLILIVTLTTTPAAAREFAADMPAMGEILAHARLYKVKHAGRPPVPYVGRYEPRHVRFEARFDRTAGTDESVYSHKSIRIFYRDALLATLEVYDLERGRGAVDALLKTMDDLRLRAEEQGRMLAVDYAAIARQNAAEAWSARDSKEAERLREIIRVE